MKIKKLQNTAGASILIVLLFLLMCTVAGSIVLTAATTSGGRLVELKDDKQDYYRIISVMKLLKEELEGQKCKIKLVQDVLVPDEESLTDIQAILRKIAEDIVQVDIIQNQQGAKNPIHNSNWTINLSESENIKVDVSVSVTKSQSMITPSGDSFAGQYTHQYYEMTIKNNSKDDEIFYELNIPIRVSPPIPDYEQKDLKNVTVVWEEGEIRKSTSKESTND